MPDLTHPELQLALDLTREAALLAARVQAEMVTPADTKPDRSPVTIGDYAAQALVAARLQAADPQAVLVAEEDAGTLRHPGSSEMLARVAHFVKTVIPAADAALVCDWIDRGSAQPGKRYWTLDPIDGTKGFLRKEQYATALALIEAGQVQIAALGCPNLSDAHKVDPGGPGSLAVAVRGQGAWTRPLNAEGEFLRLQVSAQSEPGRARLLRSAEAAHTDLDKLDEIVTRLGVSAEPVRMDSQAKYAVLAAGHGELLFRLLSPKMPDYREKLWDQAAGSLIVQEAGGMITDLDGNPLDFSAGRVLVNNRGVLASNGTLHEAALEAVKVVEA